MLQVTDKALVENDVVSISVLSEFNEPEHGNLLIDMKNVVVLYSTQTQCIFVVYKELFKGPQAPDIVSELLYGKEIARDPANGYRGFTFAIQDDSFTRVRNDWITSLVSCALRHYDQEIGLPEEIKNQAPEFPFGDLLKEQVLVVNEPRKSDVVFTSPRTPR